MSNTSPIEREIVDETASACRRAFDALRAHRPKEHFYYFGIVIQEDSPSPFPTAWSEEALAEAAAKSVPMSPEELEELGLRPDDDPADGLRFSTADSPYDQFGGEHFEELEGMFLDSQPANYDEDDEVYWQVTRRRLELLEEGLRKLDQSGYFGEGAARDAVLINVVSPGDSIDDPLGSAKRLNPPASLSKMLELYEVSAEPT